MGVTQNELNKTLINEKDGLLQENVQLKERLDIAESKIKRSKPGSGSVDGHPRVVDSRQKEIDSLERELNQFKKNTTLALCVAAFLLAGGALVAIFFISATFDEQEKNTKNKIVKVTRDKNEEIEGLERRLTEANDKIKGLEEEVGTKRAGQQNKEKTCNDDLKIKRLNGDELKKFMNECQSAKAPAPAASESGKTQQNKKDACSAEAKAEELTGNKRQTFMNECLKAK
jgi:ribosomal protein L12E/L44/L45/RPP1/RPP2